MKKAIFYVAIILQFSIMAFGSELTDAIDKWITKSSFEEKLERGSSSEVGSVKFYEEKELEKDEIQGIRAIDYSALKLHDVDDVSANNIYSARKIVVKEKEYFKIVFIGKWEKHTCLFLKNKNSYKALGCISTIHYDFKPYDSNDVKIINLGGKSPDFIYTISYGSVGQSSEIIDIDKGISEDRKILVQLGGWHALKPVFDDIDRDGICEIETGEQVDVDLLSAGFDKKIADKYKKIDFKIFRGAKNVAYKWTGKEFKIIKTHIKFYEDCIPQEYR